MQCNMCESTDADREIIDSFGIRCLCGQCADTWFCMLTPVDSFEEARE